MNNFDKALSDMPITPTPIEILLVEDNPGDIELTRIALRKARVLNELTVVEDGESALKFLNKEAPYSDVQRPDIVLLDINLPKLSGLEILERIKTNESTLTIPVIMLTSSASEDDINESYRQYANSYISKPVRSNEFFEIIQQLENFWLNLVKLPASTEVE